MRREWVWLARSGLHVVVRPWLWRAALRFVAWPPWHLGPYLHFRLETMYGGRLGDPRDIVDFLGWARSTARFAETQTEEAA